MFPAHVLNTGFPSTRLNLQVTHDLAMVRDAPSLGARAVARKVQLFFLVASCS